MSKLRFFIAIIFAYFSFNSLSGQETVNNFYIDGQLIIWQKTFQTSLSFEQLVEQIKDKGILQQIDISPNKIRGELRPVYVDTKRKGIRNAGVTYYVLYNYFTGFVLINYQDNRYKVTIKWIALSDKSSDTTKRIIPVYLEDFAFKNLRPEFDSQFHTSASEHINDAFIQRFDLIVKPEDDTW